MLMDHDTLVEDKIKESELERDTEIKANKERIDKVWKKKFDDREATLEERLKELDAEMTTIRERHEADLKRERERTEIRIRESVRAEVRGEIADQLTSDFTKEM